MKKIKNQWKINENQWKNAGKLERMNMWKNDGEHPPTKKKTKKKNEKEQIDSAPR